MTTRLSDFLVIWEHFKVIVDLPIMLLIMTSHYVIVSIKPEKKSDKIRRKRKRAISLLRRLRFITVRCATRTIGTSRSDDGDVHENVAEK